MTTELQQDDGVVTFFCECSPDVFAAAIKARQRLHAETVAARQGSDNHHAEAEECFDRFHETVQRAANIVFASEHRCPGMERCTYAVPE